VKFSATFVLGNKISKNWPQRAQRKQRVILQLARAREARPYGLPNGSRSSGCHAACIFDFFVLFVAILFFAPRSFVAIFFL
jgi:hypothetical protein